jgi:hypothetical protein
LINSLSSDCFIYDPHNPHPVIGPGKTGYVDEVPLLVPIGIAETLPMQFQPTPGGGHIFDCKISGAPVGIEQVVGMRFSSYLFVMLRRSESRSYAYRQTEARSQGLKNGINQFFPDACFIIRAYPLAELHILVRYKFPDGEILR